MKKEIQQLKEEAERARSARIDLRVEVYLEYLNSLDEEDLTYEWDKVIGNELYASSFEHYYFQRGRHGVIKHLVFKFEDKLNIESIEGE